MLECGGLTPLLSPHDYEKSAVKPAHSKKMTARLGTLSNFFLKVTDLLLVLCALALTIVLRYSPTHHNVGFAVDYLSERIKVSNALLGAALLITWHLAFAVQGLYLSHRFASQRRELKEIAQALLFCSAMLLVAAPGRTLADD
jgi:hypothetical protein